MSHFLVSESSLRRESLPPTAQPQSVPHKVTFAPDTKNGDDERVPDEAELPSAGADSEDEANDDGEGEEQVCACDKDQKVVKNRLWRSSEIQRLFNLCSVGLWSLLALLFISIAFGS